MLYTPHSNNILSTADDADDFFDETNTKDFSWVNFRKQADYEFADARKFCPLSVLSVEYMDDDEGEIEYENDEGECLTVSMCGGIVDWGDLRVWREYFGDEVGTLREDFKAIFSAEVLDCIPDAKLSYWIEYNYAGKGIENYEEWLDIDGEQGRHNLTPDGRRTDDL
jgi:hypothetical protein